MMNLHSVEFAKKGNQETNDNKEMYLNQRKFTFHELNMLWNIMDNMKEWLSTKDFFEKSMKQQALGKSAVKPFLSKIVL